MSQAFRLSGFREWNWTSAAQGRKPDRAERGASPEAERPLPEGRGKPQMSGNIARGCSGLPQ